jgi:hypothetical protein
MNRAKTIVTQKLLNDYSVCIPESQFDEYKLAIPSKNIVVHPDSVIGLAAKRNWIVDNLMDDECVVMLDDDITVLRCLLNETFDITDPAHIEEVVYTTFVAAADLGAFLFGWAGKPFPQLFKEYHPFRVTGYINGFAMGVRKGVDIRWDERNIKEDFDICLMNAHRYRVIFKQEMFCFCQTDTFCGIGGLASYRTIEMEKRGILMLRERYGRKTVTAKRFSDGHMGSSGANTVSAIPQVTMHLPY